MEPTILVNSTLPSPARMPENPDTDVEGLARILLLEALACISHYPTVEAARGRRSNSRFSSGCSSRMATGLVLVCPPGAQYDTGNMF